MNPLDQYERGEITTDAAEMALRERARDRRLAARYMAGASVTQLARPERVGYQLMHKRLVAAGAVIRKHGQRG